MPQNKPAREAKMIPRWFSFLSPSFQFGIETAGAYTSRAVILNSLDLTVSANRTAERVYMGARTFVDLSHLAAPFDVSGLTIARAADIGDLVREQKVVTAVLDFTSTKLRGWEALTLWQSDHTKISSAIIVQPSSYGRAKEFHAFDTIKRADSIAV